MLVACLEALSQFFYGHPTVAEGDITLAELFKKLLNDKSFFLRDLLGIPLPALSPNPINPDVLGKALKPGFTESRPEVALSPGPVAETSNDPAVSQVYWEDIAGIEDTLTAIVESDSNDELGWLAALVKTLLNNLCAFIFAVTELRRFFHGTGSSPTWHPTAFVISGSNTPVIHLTQAQVDSIKAWLPSALPSPVASHVKLDRFFKNVTTVNTDGSHGLLFKTQHFGLPDNVERAFAELVFNSITSGEHGTSTHQSSPNRSVHQYTPPGFSDDFRKVFSLRLAAAQTRPALPTGDEL
ncbi:hypothetical protein CALCODRAFT_531303 [Calocera cornea HHB12733]|uniref:Uncharacterized protein n=1 Tax=Calocera cornea HHB12733 TaxID=1353952 RepID=A0A165DAC8_9BASI|nr:hypothetical protein CALCODRAFT_531303 [Calocera cornea HHB12733]